MKKYKFSDLLEYEVKINNLYSKFNIAFNDLNRINQYFQYLKKIESERLKGDGDKFKTLINSNKAKFYFSQFYVLEACNIIDAIEELKPNDNILKEKLRNIVQGNYLLSEENINNSIARNTTFELSLFSFFHSKGLHAELCHPNPDISLTLNKFQYSIECKRPFSFESLEKNIYKAMKQLRRHSQIDCIPTIALSLDQVLLGKDLILDSKDEKSALSFLEKTVFEFYQHNQKMINKVCDKEPCLILYYLSCLVGFKTDLPMANGTYIVGNIYNFKEDISDSIRKDMNILQPNNE